MDLCWNLIFHNCILPYYEKSQENPWILTKSISLSSVIPSIRSAIFIQWDLYELKGGGATCKSYMIPCSLIGMSKYCCVKCPLVICSIPLTEGHLSQRERPRILRLMSLLTLLVSGLNIYAALWQILLCCGMACGIV